MEKCFELCCIEHLSDCTDSCDTKSIKEGATLKDVLDSIINTDYVTNGTIAVTDPFSDQTYRASYNARSSKPDDNDMRIFDKLKHVKPRRITANGGWGLLDFFIILKED